MQATIQQQPVSKPMFWTGAVLSALAALFLLFDGVNHILRTAPVDEASVQLGFPVEQAVAIGILELIFLVLYLIPRTSVLGAILMTGYLGGAVAAHLRIGSPLFSHLLFPVYIGLLVWGGLYLRQHGLRALIPLRR